MSAVGVDPMPGAGAPQKSLLLAAIAVAQTRARAVVKDTDNPFLKKKYASTEGILEVVKDANNGLGLSVRPKSGKLIRNADGTPIAIHKVVILSHECGESEEWEIEWPVCRKKNKQGGFSMEEDDAVAIAHTRALGYLLRDGYGLPRLEAHEVQEREADRGGDDERAMLTNTLSELAKAAIKDGVPKKQVIDALRAAGAGPDVVSDSGEWGPQLKPGALADKMIEVLKRVAPLDPSSRSSSGSAASPQNSSAPTSPTPSREPAATPAQRPIEEPKRNAPMTPGEREKAIDVPLAGREALNKLGTVIAKTIEHYQSDRKHMILHVRNWAGTPSAVTNEGGFDPDMTRATYDKIVAGLKDWEAQQLKERERANMTPEQIAEQAAEEWAAQEAAAMGINRKEGGPVEEKDIPF